MGQSTIPSNTKMLTAYSRRKEVGVEEELKRIEQIVSQHGLRAIRNGGCYPNVTNMVYESENNGGIVGEFYPFAKEEMVSQRNGVILDPALGVHPAETYATIAAHAKFYSVGMEMREFHNIMQKIFQ